MEKHLELIKRDFLAIVKRLSAPQKYASFNISPQHDGSAHFEFEGGLYFYIVTERGEEIERRSTSSSDELLFWRVSTLVFNMALDYELSHRIDSQDSRRMLFQKRIELLSSVDEKWAEKERCKLNDILKRNPFTDNLESKTI